jgi:hypothetical protein
MGVLTVSEEPTLLSAALGLGLRVAVMEVALGVGSSCCFLAGLTKNESMVRLVDMVRYSERRDASASGREV